jgi:hypothetical protein
MEFCALLEGEGAAMAAVAAKRQVTQVSTDRKEDRYMASELKFSLLWKKENNQMRAYMSWATGCHVNCAR